VGQGWVVTAAFETEMGKKRKKTFRNQVTKVMETWMQIRMMRSNELAQKELVTRKEQQQQLHLQWQQPHQHAVGAEMEELKLHSFLLHLSYILLMNSTTVFVYCGQSLQRESLIILVLLMLYNEF
jgi:hypothetical protein